MKLPLYFLVLYTAYVSTALAQLDSVLWDRSGAGEESFYGVRIVPLGDQNLDGYSDFAVWAYGSGPPGQASEALIEWFHGGNPVPQEPYMTYAINPDVADNRMAIEGIGDVNGDGFEDWAIWARYLSDMDSYAVHLHWGGSEADLIPDRTLKIPIGVGGINPVGDFNGDGYDDVCRFYVDPLDYSEIFYGGDPMDLTPDWIRHSPAGHVYEALPQSFGDLNGDSYSDLVSGNNTVVFIYLGGLAPDTLPAYTWAGESPSWSGVIHGLNGDNYDDLVFHGLRVHFGRDSLLSTRDYDLNFYGNCDPLWKFSLGDINHDGYGDMAVIDDGCNNLWGTLCLYLGHPWLNLDPAWVIQGRSAPLNLIGIRTAAGLGDVNNDGLNDFAIGAANTNFDGRRGRVVVLSGDTSLIVSADQPSPESPQELAISAYPNPFNAQTTLDVVMPIHTQIVELCAYNVLGQQVEALTLPANGGHITYSLDASTWTSGLYFLTAQAGTFYQTTKLMLLK